MTLERRRRAASLAALLLAATSCLALPRPLRADDPPPPPPPVRSEPAGPDTADAHRFSAWILTRPVPAPAWRDPRIVDRRFAEAVAAVEAFAGASFANRPTVRISTPDDVRRVLVAELAGLQKSIGADAFGRTTIDALVAATIAKYEIATHAVHVIPENVERLTGILGVHLGDEAALRAVLAHECTHALDFERHPWERIRTTLTSEAELKAFSAVVEGHAQYVAKRISAGWSISPAYDRFTSSIGTVPEKAPRFIQELLRAVVAEATFEYWQGAAFLEHVEAEAGEVGVERALTDPPKTIREIEHPSEWLHPRAPSVGVTIDPAFEALRVLAPSPSWRVQRGSLVEGALRSQYEGLAAADVATAFDDFESAQALVAAHDATGAMLVVVAVETRSDASARAFTALDRDAGRKKDERMTSGQARIASAEYVDGAGSDSRLSGYTARKRILVGLGEMPVLMTSFAADRVAFQVAVTGRVVDRAWLDRVVDALAAYVTDDAHPIPEFPSGAALTDAEKPASSPLANERSVRVRLLDPDGMEIPRARVGVHRSEPGRSTTRISEVIDGRIDLWRSATEVALFIFATRTADDEPSDLAPLYVRAVRLDGETRSFTLVGGRTLEGRVVDGSGAGIPGVEIEALPSARSDEADDFGRTTLATALTDATGAYTLRGLGTSVRLVVHAPPPFAPSAPIDVRTDVRPSDISLSTGRTSVITVFGPDGKAVPGATVSWARVQRSRPGSEEYFWTDARGSTDPDGRITLLGVPSTIDLRISVRPPSWMAGTGKIFDQAWNGSDLRVELARVRVLVGRVVDAQGRPKSGRLVHARPKGIVVGISGSAESGPDGSFEISEIPLGPMEVSVWTPSERGARWVAVEEGKPIELVDDE